MFTTWQGKCGYLVFAALAMSLTIVLSRPGYVRDLQRPVERGFGPPCSLWQAARLFCSLFWERMMLLGVTVACGLRLYLGQWRLLDLLVLGLALLAFPIVEYVLHRVLLHNWPASWPEPLSVLVHKVHHRDPWHMERAQNPGIAMIGYAVGLPIVWFPWLPLPQGMTGVAASWLVLFLYEAVHLLIHTSYKPRSLWFRRLWRNHRLHHFKSEHYWFSVAAYGVDQALWTDPPPQHIATSPTCLSLDEREFVQP